MIKIVENCTLLAKYECLNDSSENIRLQERLYPGEDINQGTEVIQILVDEKFEGGCFSPRIKFLCYYRRSIYLSRLILNNRKFQ